MARLSDLPPALAEALAGLPLPDLGETPLAGGVPLARRRVALVSTAGLSRRDDRRFAAGDADYRVLPGSIPGAELVMSHISVNYDRSGFQEDVNVVFPLDRLRELAEAGAIGSAADYHYSFMGATDPAAMEGFARELAAHLGADRVDAAVLLPV
jgi:D-proline reductase (dithiol) PrdB